MMRKDCDLSAPYFPYVFEVYQGGHSIFCHIEDRYKVEGVKSFLRSMYSEGVTKSMERNFSVSLSQFENDWKNSLENFEF